MASSDNALLREIADLQGFTVNELREKYFEVFGEPTTTRNKDYLFKRIAYRLQEKKYGGLSERARQRAADLAKDARIHHKFERQTLATIPRRKLDPRLPVPGTTLAREFRGVEHRVTVLEDGFEYNGTRFSNLSIIARAITGTRWNGYGFFGLVKKKSA